MVHCLPLHILFIYLSISFPSQSILLFIGTYEVLLYLDLILHCLSLPIKYNIILRFVHISPSLLWTIIKQKKLLPTIHSQTHTHTPTAKWKKKWKNRAKRWFLQVNCNFFCFNEMRLNESTGKRNQKWTWKKYVNLTCW